MSGCGCGQPMILNNAPAARMDVESVLMCDVLPDGTVAGQVLVEAVYDAGSGQRVGQRLVHPDTGAPYALQGELQQCSDAQNCASPTTPVTTVGLCLADGTPIAVTVVRDCAGTVTSEGWINLSTGAWTAGTVPAGTVACGDSRSIQVSGTFCDVDAAGEVVGLVLVEYTYDDTGAISSVRLVDAVTGTTYTPTGTVTVCPAGVEQPEQDAVVLCDTAPDGTVTQFLRDYRRDETGAVVGHSDYRLDGTAYTPAGTVGMCRPPACETQQLCDVQEDVAAVLPSTGVPTESWQDLPNGVRWMRRGSDGAAPGGWYAADASTPERFDFDRPVTIQYSVRFSGPTAAPLRIPAGWYLDSISTVQHTWNAATRTISPTASATQDGVSTFRIEAQTAQTMIAPGVVGTQPSGQSSQYGQITVTADQVTLFLRTLCRDGNGTVTTTDTLLDGTTPYTVLGTADRCPDTPKPPCRDCETLVLCDDGANNPDTIRGQGVTSGTLANGVTWTARTSHATAQPPSKLDNEDGAWWGQPEPFPNPVVPPYTWTFSLPSVVEFSVYMAYIANPTETNDNCMEVPAGVEVVYLPEGWVYDPDANRVCVTADQTGDLCTNLLNPTIAQSARFRTTGPVTSIRTFFLGPRRAMCGQFHTSWTGAIKVTPTGQFLRRICRDCDGTVASVTDTLLDGTTPYTVAGAVGTCQAGPEDCCQPVQVCISDTSTETIHFISNEAQVDDDSIDTVWTWTNGGDANGPAADATWYQMYRARYGSNPAAWSVTDSAPTRKAGWISPHPNGATTSTGAPGEGPTLSGTTDNPMRWWARAAFSLPAAADPDSIRVQITVLNADQQASRFRLNNGTWTSLPSTATYQGTPYTFGPGTVPGAQPGTNTLYFEVLETVPDAPNNGAGVMAHFIVTYDVPGLGQRSWTRMVCCDGTVYYIDEHGERQDDLPPSSSVVPCGASAQPMQLCDDNGPFFRHVSYVGDQILTMDTDLNGSAYTPAGPVVDCGGSGAPAPDGCARQVIERCGCDDTTGDGLGDVQYTELWAVDPCNGEPPVLLGTYRDGDPTQPYTPTAPVECTAAETLPGPLSTGVRAVTGTAPQNLASAFPGLQSVSLTVLAGAVNVTMSDGAAVPIPAGVTMTWSVAQDADTALAAASFTGASAAASYLLNWTYK